MPRRRALAPVLVPAVLVATLLVALAGLRAVRAEEAPRATVVVRCATEDLPRIRTALDRLGIPNLEVEVFVPKAPPTGEEEEEGLEPLADARPVMHEALRLVNGVSRGPADGALVERFEADADYVRLRVRLSELDVLDRVKEAFAGNEHFDGLPRLRAGPSKAEGGGWRADLVLARAAPTGRIRPVEGQIESVDYDALLLLSDTVGMRLLRAGRLNLERRDGVVTLRQRFGFEPGTLQTFDRLLARIADRPNVVVESISWALEAPTVSATSIRMPEIHVARRFVERPESAPAPE